ncbi:hypothetical protein Bca101_019336 [Brassica carinata]
MGEALNERSSEEWEAVVNDGVEDYIWIHALVSFSITISSAIFIGDKLPGSTLSYHDPTTVVSKQSPSPPPGRKPSSSPSHELSIQHARMDSLKPKSYNPNKEGE